MGKKRKFSGLHKENRKTGSGKSSKLGSKSDSSETHSENSLENTEVSATLAAANSVLYSDIPTDIQSTDPYTSTPVSKRSDNITHSPVMSTISENASSDQHSTSSPPLAPPPWFSEFTQVIKTIETKILNSIRSHNS
jgi:hypothetical protein